MSLSLWPGHGKYMRDEGRIETDQTDQTKIRIAILALLQLQGSFSYSGPYSSE